MRKAKTKAEKVLHKIYTKLYEEASPSVNYDEFIEACIARGKTREVDGKFIVPYDYYFIDSEKNEKIIESIVNRYKLSEFEKRGVRFHAYLGHGPTSRVVEVKDVEEYIYDFPTKYEEGFTGKEVDHIKELFTGMYPDFSKDAFLAAFRGNTCMVKEGVVINYHCDVVKAVLCGIENRDLKLSEFD